MLLQQRIYADYAAHFPVLPEVGEVFVSAFSLCNPSGIYSEGRAAREMLDGARDKVAQLLGCRDSISGKCGNIYFTSGGTEADNWAIFGILHSNFAKNSNRRRIITSKIEHHAIINPALAAAAQGFDVSFIDVDAYGRLDIRMLARELDRYGDSTAMVALMYANNEIGTLQDITAAAALAHSHGAVFFSDAVAAAGTLPINLSGDDGCIDMLSLSGHKFGAPTGAGVLFVRDGICPENLIFGGEQEYSHRGGTENLPAIIALAKALELSVQRREKNPALTALTEKIAAKLSEIPDSYRNGHPTLRLPGTVTFSFDGVDGESLVLWLDAAGISASAASACSAGKHLPSHVLLSTGRTEALAKSALRLSLSAFTTQEEAEIITEAVKHAVGCIRAANRA